MKIYPTTVSRHRARPSSSTSQETDNQNSGFSVMLSIIAIVISAAGIYFQFFFEKFDMNVSVIENNVSKDSLQLSMIYNNKGNQDGTIISTSIFFYAGKNLLKRSKRLYPIQNLTEPYILPPNKQMFVAPKVLMNFSKQTLLEYGIRMTDTLFIGLDIQYLGNNLLQSELIRNCGWLTFFPDRKLNAYFIQFQRIQLDASEYFVSAHNTTSATKVSSVETKVVSALETLRKEIPIDPRKPQADKKK